MAPPTQKRSRWVFPAKYRRLWRQTPLFHVEGGIPLRFYIRPGQAKLEVAPLILHEGGRLCAVQEPGAILLAGPGEIPAGAPGMYTSTLYIMDCLMCNRLLPLEDYCLNAQEEGPREAAPSGSASGGWMPFTVADDTDIVQYVQRKGKAGQADNLDGTAFWKEMAEAQVTAHPWQAVRSRYLKHLRGKEEIYQLGWSSQRRAPEEPATINKAEQMLAIVMFALAQGAKEKAADVPWTQVRPRAAGPSKIPPIFKRANKEFEDDEGDSESTSSEEEIVPKDTGPNASEEATSAGPKAQGAMSTDKGDLAGSESLLPAEEEVPSSGPSAREVALAVEDMKRLMAEFGVDLATVTQALLKNSGEVAAAASCLRTGQRADGRPLWTRQDDLELSTGSEAVRSKLAAKYGAENVKARVAFRKS